MSKSITSYEWPSTDIMTDSTSVHNCLYSEIGRGALVFSLLNKEGGCTSVQHAYSQKEVQRGTGFRYRGTVSAKDWATLVTSSSTLLLYGDYYVCGETELYKNGITSTIAMNQGDRIVCSKDGYLNSQMTQVDLSFETSYLDPVVPDRKNYQEYIDMIVSGDKDNTFYEIDDATNDISQRTKKINLKAYKNAGPTAVSLKGVNKKTIKAYVDLNTYRVDTSGRLYVRLKDGEQDE